jgi:surface antigen
MKPRARRIIGPAERYVKGPPRDSPRLFERLVHAELFAMASRYSTVLALMLAVACAPALASNVQFLRDTPISKMTKEDLELFRTNMHEALEHDADGATRRWENPKTGTSGTLTPVSTFVQDGAKCRRLEIVNSVQGLTGRSTFNMCKQIDGAWVNVAPPPK